MPSATTLLALPVLDLAILGGLAVFCVVFGWKAQRQVARGREAALQRGLREARGAIPQLESAARAREQRAETLAMEVRGLKERLSEQEMAARQKEIEIGKRDRDIRSLTSELQVLKEGSSNAGKLLLLDGQEDAADPTAVDPEMAKRYAALEARYDALARGLFQRDDRIAELEEQLRNPGNGVPTRTLEEEFAELEQTSSTLRTTLGEREEQLQALQTRLQDEVTQREAFEDLARRRGDGNRELKAAASRLEQQIPALKQDIRGRDEQIAERDGKLVSMNRALREERQRREAREAELTELQAQLATLIAGHESLEQRLHEQDEVRRVLQGELESTRTTLRETERTVRERETAIADLERHLAETRERLQAGERTAAALENTIKDRDFKIAEAEAAANQQSAKLELLRSTFSEAKAAHNDSIGALTARHDEERRALERSLAEQQRTLADRERELADALARASATLRQRQGVILRLVTQLGTSPLLLPAPVAAPSITQLSSRS